MTIVTEVTHTSAGFTLRLAAQIGCATTDDHPSAESERSASEELRRRLAPLTARVERAYAHFAAGAHPMTVTRRHVGSGDFAAEAWWRDASIQIHLKPGTPDIARQKAPVDFLFALAFAGEFRDAPWTFPAERAVALQLMSTSGTGLAGILGLAVTQPDWFRSSPQGIDDPIRRFRLKVLQRVLDRKPYADLIQEATTLDRIESVRWLMHFLSEVQLPELPKLLEITDPVLRGTYGAIRA